MEILCAGHPRLALYAFSSEFEPPLGEVASPDWLRALLSADAEAPVRRSEEVRSSVRDMLRFGGYKPTGRGKPASEYLVRAAQEGKLNPINLAVDANNAVSLHSGLPISVLDADQLHGPLSVSVAAEGTRYVFNAAGQEIDVSGLLCAADGEGPCGNAVKDAQRTKTSERTRGTVSLVWGCQDHLDHSEATRDWYVELLRRAGVNTTPCLCTTHTD